MLYSKLEDEVKKLSSKYSFEESDSIFGGKNIILKYGDKRVLNMSMHKPYRFSLYMVDTDDFYRLPYSNKLWMLVNEFVMTPIDERLREKEYNVIIADNGGKGFDSKVICYKAESYIPFDIDMIDKVDLVLPEYKFTRKEYKELIKYIKTLPDGEFQAKVAEHGKTLNMDRP